MQNSSIGLSSVIVMWKLFVLSWNSLLLIPIIMNMLHNHSRLGAIELWLKSFHTYVIECFHCNEERVLHWTRETRHMSCVVWGLSSAARLPKLVYLWGQKEWYCFALSVDFPILYLYKITWKRYIRKKWPLEFSNLRDRNLAHLFQNCTFFRLLFKNLYSFFNSEDDVDFSFSHFLGNQKC